MSKFFSLAYLTLPNTHPVDQIEIAAQCGYEGVGLRTISQHLPGEPDYALANGLRSGVSDREFAPGSTLTRAMVAQMLYSLEGKPAAGRADFADVAEGAWYADAISWAAGEGIVSGYGDTFGPNDPITREQLALILYGYDPDPTYDDDRQRHRPRPVGAEGGKRRFQKLPAERNLRRSRLAASPLPPYPALRHPRPYPRQPHPQPITRVYAATIPHDTGRHPRIDKNPGRHGGMP